MLRRGSAWVVWYPDAGWGTSASLFTAQHVSNVSTSIFRSLLFTIDLFHVLYCSVRKSTLNRKLLKMDVLTFETCWAVNSEIIKQVTSSLSNFIQHNWRFLRIYYPTNGAERDLQYGHWLLMLLVNINYCMPHSYSRTWRLFERTASSWNKVKCKLDATRQFIDVFLARHVLGTYAHHQEH